MRLLVVASTFPASNTDPVPAFVRDQIIAIKKQRPDIEISVLAPHDKRSNTTDFTQHEHYSEYRFHYFWPHSTEKLAGRGILPALKQNKLNYLLVPFLFIGEFASLWRLTRKLKPDVIYAHWFTPQAVTVYLASLVTRVPFVYTTHAADVDVWNKIPLLGKLVVRIVSRKADAITAVSPRSLAKLERFFNKSQWRDLKPKTAIIPMGVELPGATNADPAALKQTYDLDDQRVIFFMGRLAEKKGVSYLLEAFSELNTANLKLIIAGDGPLRTELENQARALNINDRVVLTGFLSGQQKTDYISLADLVVLPSIITKDGDAEGLPVVFMEALAAGKICIATNESGADNIITDGESGFLLPHKDSQKLKATIEMALNLSPRDQAKLKTNAREVSRQFDWVTVAHAHIDFFKF